MIDVRAMGDPAEVQAFLAVLELPEVSRHFAALRIKPTEYRNHRGSSEIRRIAHIDMGLRPGEGDRP